MYNYKLETYPIGIRPLVVIDKRLRYHAEAGKMRILDGMLIEKEAEVGIFGGDTLPACVIFQYTTEEEIFPGAGRMVDHPGNGVFRTIGEMEILVAAKREYGMFGREDLKHRNIGVNEWAERVKDAIDTSEDGKTDSFLEDTCSQPVTFNIEENYISDLTFALILRIGLTTIPHYRGQRFNI